VDKMNHIKVVIGLNAKTLEDNINEFLDKNNDIEIIDIKLTSCSDEYENYIYALIHYIL